MSDKEKKPHEYRGVRDEIRQQQLKTKDMSVKGKLSYFWDYYKVHTIVCIIALAILAGLIHDIASAKDCCFYAFVFNSSQISSESMEDAFASYAGLNVADYTCIIDTTPNISQQTYSQYDMASSQKLVALVQAGDLDAVIMPPDVFYNYALSEMFTDLRTILKEEELKSYGNALYYIDQARITHDNENTDYEEEYINSVNAQTSVSTKELLAEAETHRHPENMAEPVPVGIYMGDSPFVQKTGIYPQSAPIFGIVSTSLRTNTGKQYLDFLWDKTIDFSQMLSEY